MSGFSVRIEHAPELDHLEELETIVLRELARLMEYARDRLRMVQDVETELAETPSGGGQARLHQLRYELRVVARQLQRAQANLVPAGDERAAVAPRVLGWLEDAEREDRPWRTAA